MDRFLTPWSSLMDSAFLSSTKIYLHLKLLCLQQKQFSCFIGLCLDFKNSTLQPFLAAIYMPRLCRNTKCASYCSSAKRQTQALTIGSCWIKNSNRHWNSKVWSNLYSLTLAHALQSAPQFQDRTLLFSLHKNTIVPFSIQSTALLHRWTTVAQNTVTQISASFFGNEKSHFNF